MIILLISTLISFTSSASEINISYGPQNELILKDKSCEVLKKQASAICTFKQQLDSVVISEKLNCVARPAGQFELKISQCLPDFVKATQNKTNYNSGPNCWGTALYMKGISRKPRFVWPTEMAYWLDSPVCRKLAPGEKLQPGDILNIYGPEYKFTEQAPGSKDGHFWEALFPGRNNPGTVKEGYTGFHKMLHSETYISDRLTFGKDSPSRLDKFKFNSLINVYGRTREAECQENQTITPHLREYQNKPQNIRNSKCAYFSNAYRCGNVNAYFNKPELTDSQKSLKRDIESLYQYQSQLFDFVMIKGKVIPERDLATMLAKADDLAAESLRDLKSGANDKTEEMLLVLKYFTASGIRKSLELAELIPATEPL